MPKKELIIALLVFLITAVIFTWPLVSHFGSAIPVGGEPAAVAITQLFTVQWTGMAIEQGKPYWSPQFFYPYKGAFAWGEPQPLFCLLVWALSKLTGYTIAYNIAIFLYLAGFGLAVYALARLLTDDRVASLWCGIWATAGAYSLEQLSEPPLLAMGFPAACILFSLRYIKDRKEYLFWLAVIMYIATWFACGQLAFYLTICLPLILIPYLSSVKWRISGLFRIFLALGVTLAVVLPYSLAHLHYARQMGFAWAADDLARGSLRVSQLFIPATRHWLTSRVLHRWLYSWDIGIIPLAVIILAIIMGALKTQARDDFRKRMIVGLVFMIVVALAMAFGTSKPYRLIASVIPGMEYIRIPVRSCAFAILGVAVLSASALAYLRARIRTAVSRNAATIVITIFLFAEMWIAPIRLFDVKDEISRNAGAVDWLKSHGNGGPVLELPLARTYWSHDMALEAGAQLRMLRHGNPVLNGFATFEPDAHLQLRHAFRSDPEGKGRRYLDAYGARYCLVHKDGPKQPVTGSIVYEDAGHVIYALPVNNNTGEENDYLPLCADFKALIPQKGKAYSIPLSRMPDKAVLIMPVPGRKLRLSWGVEKDKIATGDMFIRGSVILDAGQRDFCIKLLKLPHGGKAGEAKLIPADGVSVVK